MKLITRSLDTRSKMTLWLSSMVTGVILPIGWPLAIYLAIVVAVIISVGNCTKNWMTFGLKLVLPTAVMLFVVYGFLIPPSANSALIEIGDIKISISGLWISLGVAARLLVVGGTTLAFIKNTPPTELSTGLRTIGTPSLLTTVLVSSFSVHTLVIRKIHQISDAQRSRGLRPSSSIADRMRMYAPILRPLLFTMLNAAVERSALWQSRGYLKIENDQGLDMHWEDALAIVLAMGFIVCAGLIRWVI